MTIEEMKRRKKELGYSYERMSELSGVPVGTIQKIFCGVTGSPRFETLQALEKIFLRHPEACRLYEDKNPSDDRSMVRETMANYSVKKSGEYTLEDYYALPEERRVELIDGVFYDMTAPALLHQLIVGEIFRCFSNYIRGSSGLCIPMMAPADVQLDQDDKTMVEPDVLVVCDRDKINGRCVVGAPDLVVEVLSKSTRKKDMFLKLQKYMDAGVQEYWMVDPDRKKIIVYDFAHDDYPVIYGFGQSVPVGIFEGSCEVDFKEIYEYVKFLYGRKS